MVWMACAIMKKTQWFSHDKKVSLEEWGKNSVKLYNDTQLVQILCQSFITDWNNFASILFANLFGPMMKTFNVSECYCTQYVCFQSATFSVTINARGSFLFLQTVILPGSSSPGYRKRQKKRKSKKLSEKSRIIYLNHSVTTSFPLYVDLLEWILLRKLTIITRLY